MKKYSLQKKEDSLLSEKTIYRKRRHSDVSKAKRKSKHKHDYEDCLVTEDGSKFHLANRCIVCDKLGTIHFFIAEKNLDEKERMSFTVLPQEKLLKKYRHLPKYFVADFFKSKKIKGLFKDEKRNP